MKRLFQHLRQIIQRNKTAIAQEDVVPPVLQKAPMKKSGNEVEIKISTMSLIKILATVALFLGAMEVVVQLKSILITIVICFIIAMGVSPLLDSLEQRRIPRPIAILILYIIFFGVMVLVVMKVLPILAEQLLGIALDLRDFVISNEINIPFLDQLGNFAFDSQSLKELIADNLLNISQNIKEVAGSTLGIISGVFQGLLSFLFAIVLLFFILLEREKIGNFIIAFLPKKNQHYVIAKANSMKYKMSKWFRGQFILMVIVGVAMYVGMKIFEITLGMKYAATIAIFAGLMELLPYIGVTISTTLAGIIALNVSPAALVAVLIWMISIQFLEGNFLVPLVMEKAIGLSSSVVFIVITIGATLGYATGGMLMGILGMIFSVPIAATVSIFIEDYANKHR